ncbi:hypothetical protein QBC43DRAFT_105218 [Cladorrhinum sp. PSN259]|nr:hypothetical protein QBC43DRAFT_105218 [Cladorrhinum sp. PSN259]
MILNRDNLVDLMLEAPLTSVFIMSASESGLRKQAELVEEMIENYKPVGHMFSVFMGTASKKQMEINEQVKLQSDNGKLTYTVTILHGWWTKKRLSWEGDEAMNDFYKRRYDMVLDYELSFLEFPESMPRPAPSPEMTSESSSQLGAVPDPCTLFMISALDPEPEFVMVSGPRSVVLLHDSEFTEGLGSEFTEISGSEFTEGSAVLVDVDGHETE